MILNNVDLPHPEGPMTARNSPGATSSEMSSSAVRLPSVVAKRIATLSTTRIGDFACVAGVARSLVETTATGRSASGARHRGRYGGGVAGLDPHIDDGDLTGIDRGNRLFQNAGKIVGLGDRTEADCALRAAHGGEIDFGISHALADPFVFDWAIARACHALLVQLVVIERAVVGEHEEERNLVMHGRPHRGNAHQEIAVAANRDRQAAGAFESERRADGNARPAADAAAAIGADIVERMAECEPAILPRQRQMRISHWTVTENLAQGARDIFVGEAGRLLVGGFAWARHHTRHWVFA